jgi:Protein of unknown function (DUF3106)
MTSRARSWVLAALVACAVVLAPAFAQEPPAAPAGPVSWSSLSPDQQRLLSKFGNDWNSMPPARQQALARGSERWLGMSQTEKDQARDRFSRWQSLPPEQRQALRQRWQRFQSLSPQQKAEVRDNFHRFQQLPPARRQMLREQWRNASPAQRAQMIQHAREQRAARHPALGHPPPPHR